MLGVSRAREADEDDVAVVQAAGGAAGVRAQPDVQRGLGGGGDRDLALDVTLAAHEEVVMGAVRPGAADRADR